MSHQAHGFVIGLDNVSSGEKNLLQALAWFHNHRTGVCCPSVPTIAARASISERHASRLLRELCRRKVIAQERRSEGGHWTTCYTFVGMTSKASRGDICDSAGMTFEVARDDIPSSAIRKEQVEQEKQQEDHHALTRALKDWFAIKQRLETIIPEAEYALWVRPMYLLRSMGGNLLLSLPPNGKIVSAAVKRKPELTAIAQEMGYRGVSLTHYPDDYQRERLEQEFPEFAAQMLGNKKQPQSRRFA